MSTSRLSVIVEEDAMHGHKPQYQEIVHRAHAAGLAGASVFRGIEGYGASRSVHTSRILSLTGKLPVLVVIVDDTEQVRAFVPVLRELGVRGVVMLEDVELL